MISCNCTTCCLTGVFHRYTDAISIGYALLRSDGGVMRNSLTRFNMALDGFACALLAIIHCSRLLMACLSGTGNTSVHRFQHLSGATKIGLRTAFVNAGVLPRIIKQELQCCKCHADARISPAITGDTDSRPLRQIRINERKAPRQDRLQEPRLAALPRWEMQD